MRCFYDEGMTLTVGDAVPEFTAVQDNGRPFDQRVGQWRVLFFFPKTSTTHCQLQARRYQAQLGAFEALGVEVVGVNSDPQQDQLQFRSTCQLGYPLLNDGNQVISEAFGVLDDPWPGESVRRPRRETFLVDPEGVIRFHWLDVDPARDAEVVLDAVREVQRGETASLLI